MYKKQTTCTCIKLDVVVNSDRVKYINYIILYEGLQNFKLWPCHGNVLKNKCEHNMKEWKYHNCSLLILENLIKVISVYQYQVELVLFICTMCVTRFIGHVQTNQVQINPPPTPFHKYKQNMNFSRSPKKKIVEGWGGENLSDSHKTTVKLCRRNFWRTESILQCILRSLCET